MKKGVIIVGLLSVVLLAGCSNKSSSSSSSPSPSNVSTTKSSVMYYQKLTKAEKKEVKFEFKATKVSNGYDISVKIKNESSKQVKFDMGEISIFSPESSEIDAQRDEKIVVKPHEAVTVKKLFTDIPADILNDSSNYFIYLNQKNKLGRFTFQIASGTATKQANDLESGNTYKPTTNSEAPKAAQTNQQPQATAKILTSAEMAKALYMHSMSLPSTRTGISVSDTANGYKVVDDAVGANLGMTSYYNYAGDELDANGNVIATFAQLSKPTAIDPSGFQYNGTNYNQY